MQRCSVGHPCIFLHSHCSWLWNWYRTTVPAALQPGRSYSDPAEADKGSRSARCMRCCIPGFASHIPSRPIDTSASHSPLTGASGSLFNSRCASPAHCRPTCRLPSASSASATPSPPAGARPRTRRTRLPSNFASAPRFQTTTCWSRRTGGRETLQGADSRDACNRVCPLDKAGGLTEAVTRPWDWIVVLGGTKWAPPPGSADAVTSRTMRRRRRCCPA